jgi:hypothetical protein
MLLVIEEFIVGQFIYIIMPSHGFKKRDPDVAFTAIVDLNYC